MITLLTFAHNPSPEFQEIANMVIPQRDEYCQRHGYRHAVVLDGFHDRSLYYAIQRLMWVREEFRSGLSHLVWVLNLAAVITDPAKPLQPFIRRKSLLSPAAIYITRDRNGLNAGSFVLRYTSRTEVLLSYLIEHAKWNGDLRYEQHAMQIAERDVAFTGLFEIVDPPAFNQYFHSLYGWPTSDRQNWQPGDFCLHFPGRPLPEQVDLVREALAWVRENR